MFSSYPAQLGKYLVQAHLGSGSFGHVFKVHDRAIDSERALKLIQVSDPTQYAAKLREPQIMETCCHANIVHLWEADVVEVAGSRYVAISMEYLPAGSIEAKLSNGTFITCHNAVRIVRQVLMGLEHAHAHGVLHRDIKPGNLMLDQKGNVKLSDFGLAVDPSGIKGTPLFYSYHAAPELVAGDTPTNLCDIYALGVTFYRLLNNIEAFDSEDPNDPDFERRITAGKFPDRKGYMPHVPPKLRRIVNEAMHVDPGKRVQCCADFANRLNRVRLNIDWLPVIYDESWESHSVQNSNTVELVKRKKRVEVVFKRNGRRENCTCEDFSTEAEARQYLFNVLQESTVE